MTNIPDPMQRGAAGNDQNQSAANPQMNLADQARDWSRDLKNKASEMGETLGETAREQVSRAKEAASGLGATATRGLNNVLQDQRKAGADYVSGIAQAIDRAAGEFERDIPQAAQYIRKAGRHAETVATAIRDREPRELVHDLEGFARRQPAVFFGGAMLLGFAALRFLKSAPVDRYDRAEGV